MSTSQTKMHDDEIPIDVALVQRLLADQFPHLANKKCSILNTAGTVNAICRLDDDLYVRLPRKASWSAGIVDELTWLPQLAPHLTLTIPTPYAKGESTKQFPHSWAIYHWLEGEPYETNLVRDELEAATDLATFVNEIRAIPTEGAPTVWRKPLAELDEITRASIEASAGMINVVATRKAWDVAVQSEPWDGNGVWMHGDLLKGNLLVNEGRLSAIIDFGLACVGDPAADLIPAWAVFGTEARAAYRQSLAVDDATWSRACAYALHQAVMIIPYYRESNPRFAEMAVRTVREVVEDSKATL